MPSDSLLRWQNDRLVRLRALEAQVALAPPSALADENLRASVAMLCAHFQGFCRDLYTEGAQRITLAVPPPLQLFVQRQSMAELKLSTGNPNLQTLTHDFNRLVSDVKPRLDANPANAVRLNHLADLNKWRNYVVHHGVVAPPGPPLAVPLVRVWQSSCDGLATDLDRIVYDVLSAMLSAPAW